MSKKKIVKVIKLQIPAGKANPAPPIGPALGSAGVQIMAFCKEFNARTQGQGGQILPVVISVYQDKTFSFVLKKPPVAEMIKSKSGAPKGSSKAGRDKLSQRLNTSDLEAIAKDKMEDLRVNSMDAAMRLVAGTARSMGIEVDWV